MNRISKRSLALLCFDFAAIMCAYLLAFFIRFDSVGFASAKSPFLAFSFLVFPFLFYMMDLYYPFKYFQKLETFLGIVFCVSAGSIVMAAISYADRSFLLPRFVFLYISVFLILFIYLIRLCYDLAFTSHFWDKKVLVLGTGTLACEIARTVKETMHSGMDIVGLVSETKKNPAQMRKNGFPIVGNISSLVSLIDWYGIQSVILAMDPKQEMSEMDVMSELIQRRVVVISAVHVFETITEEVPYKLLGSHFLLGLMAQVRSLPYLRLKRVIDLIFGTLLFIPLFPILLAAIFLMWITGQRNPFFRQTRIGRFGVPFSLLKLRTMTDPKKGKKQKITALGRWIRRYRIDEIPQILNVIKGDMSLIGPRPEIPYFVARSRQRIPFYDAVFTVKPGLTGWAQVKFRHAVSLKDYEQKFRYNLYYLKNLTFALDLIILFKTVRVVLLGKGK